MALPPGAPHALVRQFLRHYGYAASLAALDAAAPSDCADAAGCAADAQRDAARAAVRAALQRGDVDAAEAALRAAFPGLLPEGAADAPPEALAGPAADVFWALAAARYLEALRAGDAVAAVTRARAQLGPFRGSSATRDAALAQLAALLAYDTASLASSGAADADAAAAAACPLAHLLSQRQREASADAVNHALLRASEAGEADPTSAMERALRQLAAVEGALREAAGAQGEPFCLRTAMLGAGSGAAAPAASEARAMAE